MSGLVSRRFFCWWLLAFMDGHPNGDGHYIFPSLGTPPLHSNGKSGVNFFLTVRHAPDLIIFLAIFWNWLLLWLIYGRLLRRGETIQPTIYIIYRQIYTPNTQQVSHHKELKSWWFGEKAAEKGIAWHGLILFIRGGLFQLLPRK